MITCVDHSEAVVVSTPLNVEIDLVEQSMPVSCDEFRVSRFGTARSMNDLRV